MAGINRLGKGAPKPGSIRPPDGNKNRTLDVFSQGAETDVDYQRLVNDIEDMQQRQGWLHGTGAFDKGDLLYLRDHAELQRYKEQEMRDQELNQFQALRAQQDGDEEEKPGTEAAKKPPAKPAAKPPSVAKPGTLVLPVVKVTPGHQSAGAKGATATTPSTAAAANDTGAPDAGPVSKRPRSEAEDAAGPSAGPSGHGGSGKKQQRLPSSRQQPAQDNSAEAGLAGLLGDYGSDSDDSVVQGVTVKPPSSSKPKRGNSSLGPGAARSGPSVELPDAAQLLGVDDVAASGAEGSIDAGAAGPAAVSAEEEMEESAGSIDAE